MPKIDQLTKTLNWKLRRGSHEFPGKNGGTCINEAAIVAAGFPYREVGDASDLPECFSPAFGQFLIELNDRMRADLRQELLLPFVTRLAGSRDDAVVEWKRLKYIADALRRELVPTITSRKILSQVEQLITTGDRHMAVDEVDPKLVHVASALAMAVNKVATATKRPTPIYDIACKILDRAMEIGNHGSIDAIEAARERMAAAQGTLEQAQKDRGFVRKSSVDQAKKPEKTMV